jgi:hypothetical protein
MANSFVVVNQSAEIQVLGAKEVLDVQQVGIRTRPTGIYLEYPIPKIIWPTDGGMQILESLAAGVEQMVSEGFAVTGQHIQDVDENGLLVDYVEFVVQLRGANGVLLPQTTTARVPEEWFIAGTDPFAFGLIGDATAILQAAYDNLARTAGL